MIVSCQLSIYALGVDDLSAPIASAVDELRRHGLDADVGPMSTYVVGESDALFEGLKHAFAEVSLEGQVVLTATISNACPLPKS
jgi:uncharacterized protein YqgV (UPF0045/DUF77 family)